MKNLSVFKNDNKTSDSAPDYRLVASYKDAEGNWQNETVASLWKGDTTKQNGPVLSGKMSEARSYEGKNYPGYKIEVEGTPVATEPVAPQGAVATAQVVDPADIPF